ncbi:MAG: pantoate--beta-alanine ligase [Chloroflexi bacterium]|nr:pantoate--beta-alanine ligase [Chloroflexota bacterium]
MQLIPTIAEMRALRSSVENGGVVGLIPTMGYLHAGHISHVKRARAADDIVVVSIFVNPTQFGPNEDFSRYPRDMESDLKLLEQAGVDWVFAPDAQEMYPPGYATYVDVLGVTDVLEGAARLGHFRGVATVVAKLFNIVQPHHAYFGQKDAQQVAVIRKMVRELNFPVEIVVGETMRAADGLAMSSRNIYLGTHERKAALVLHKSLEAVSELWNQGERRGSALREAMSRTLDAEPLARPDYVSVADPQTLRELDDSGDARQALASLAVRIGNTRLIDNFVLGEE